MVLLESSPINTTFEGADVDLLGSRTSTLLFEWPNLQLMNTTNVSHTHRYTLATRWQYTPYNYLLNNRDYVTVYTITVCRCKTTLACYPKQIVIILSYSLLSLSDF